MITIRHDIEIGPNLARLLCGDTDSLHQIHQKLDTIAAEMAAGNAALAVIAAIGEALSINLTSNQSQIMTKLQDIQDAIDAQNTAITDEIEQINAKLDSLTSDLAAAGTDAERQALVDSIKASTARISGIVEDAPVVVDDGEVDADDDMGTDGGTSGDGGTDEPPL